MGSPELLVVSTRQLVLEYAEQCADLSAPKEKSSMRAFRVTLAILHALLSGLPTAASQLAAAHTTGVGCVAHDDSATLCNHSAPEQWTALLEYIDHRTYTSTHSPFISRTLHTVYFIHNLSFPHPFSGA